MQNPYSIPERVEFCTLGAEQLPGFNLYAPGGRATVSLHGAQLLSYKPGSGQELLWLSPKARFQPGIAIRGGIPVCWPWFGAHPDGAGFPAHGFARTSLWTVRSSQADAQSTELCLGLNTSQASLDLWPHRFDLELQIRLDQRLSLTLRTRNDDEQPFAITEALHSYFAIGAIDQIAIDGLAGCRYRDKLDGMNWKDQLGEMAVVAPFDRVYDHPDTTLLTDSVAKRQIRLQKANSRSTVVWNPGDEVAAQMADIGSGNSAQFVCIEAGNCGERQVELQPGQSHSLELVLESCPVNV